MLLLAALRMASLAFTPSVTPIPIGWQGHGGNGQHIAQSVIGAQHLSRIVWSTPVDLNPRYSGNDLLSHYGTPCVTMRNNVVVPLKLNVDSGFQVKTLSGASGAPLWTAASDYVMPPHGWTPSFGPCLVSAPATTGSPSVQLAAWPMAGGRVAFRSADAASASVSVVTFYGDVTYQANASAYNDAVRICTPLTPGADGSVYFGFKVLSDTPAHLKSGVAKISAAGVCSWVAATDAANDAGITQVKMNGAPAITRTGDAIYVPLSNGDFGRGVLAKIDAATMTPITRVALKDPKSGLDALIDDSGTACPLVAPDGDVYYGVLENSFGSNHLRGWMLHFSGDLKTTKIPGAFGWDDTASVVPSKLVASYHGTSAYLLVTKYNNYVEGGGSGANKIGLLDPFASSVESVSGISTMAEVATITGPTPDAEFVADHPSAVREWCVNSAAVDIPNKCVILNCEDGVLYRWSLTSLTLTESIRLTDGIGEAYTPTLIGTDGKAYGISNARLYAVGNSVTP